MYPARFDAGLDAQALRRLVVIYPQAARFQIGFDLHCCSLNSEWFSSLPQGGVCITHACDNREQLLPLICQGGSQEQKLSSAKTFLRISQFKRWAPRGFSEQPSGCDST
jgi:hypothetical protein